MPGANCSIFGCSTSRMTKDCSIFKIPAPNNDLTVITKDRVKDDSLKRQISAHSLHICEKHFSEDQFYIYPTRKSLKEGAIPSLNLPQNSISFTSPHCSAMTIKKFEGSCTKDLSSSSSY